MSANSLWADLFVAELARCGLQAVCIAPGSRSTPLTLAFDRQPAIRVYLHLDERSAAFFALGMAQAGDRPVALVCTSGTAAAEFFAAVIEAHQAQIPLLVLTTDRPHELRHSGANQTMDQVKLYGDHVLWSVDMALPEDTAPALRNVQATACRAYARADGLVKGPVHINFPFRKPLEPQREDAGMPVAVGPAAVQLERGTLLPGTGQVEHVAELVSRHERGLVICGPRCPGGDFPQQVAALAHRSGYPLLCDPLSGLRFGPHVERSPVIGAYESFLAGTAGDTETPDVIIRFGAVPTSNRLNQYLSRQPARHHLHIRESGVWADDSHLVNHFLQVNEIALCEQVGEIIAERGETGWNTRLLTCETRTWQVMQEEFANTFFEGTAVARLVESLRDDTSLFIGNSLSIRHVDQFGRPNGRRIRVFGNRGVSGIDGVTSSALGVAAAITPRRTVLVTGDIAFYHDLNGLLAVGRHSLRHVTILLLNNNGGGIFRRLPVSRFEPAFTSLFLTPHGLDFEPAIRMYGLSHLRIQDAPELESALDEAERSAEPCVIEVRSDSAQDEAVRRSLETKVQHVIRSLA